MNDFFERKPNPWRYFYRAAWVIIILFIGLLLAAAGTAFADDLDQKTKEMFAPTVQINKNCSGVLFHSDRDKYTGKVETYILTAKHCFGDLNRGDLSFVSIDEYNNINEKVSETRYNAFIYGKSFFNDLATLKLKNETDVFLNQAVIAKGDIAKDLKFGEDVFVTGYPLGLGLTFTKGNLGNIEVLSSFYKPMISNSGRFYRATPPVAGGNSGGPLFVKKNGKYQVIGITTGGWTVPGGFMNYFTPVDEINEYLNSVRKTFKTEFKFYGEE